MTNDAFALQQGNLEQGLIASAVSSEEFWLELKRKVSSEDFVTQKAVFQFVEQYQLQFGNLPTGNVIGSKFDWHPPLGDFHFWLQEMQRYTMARKITEAMQETFRSISDPLKARDILLDKLTDMRTKETNHIQAYDQSAPERWNKYMLRNQYLFEAKKMLGQRTGMSIIDNTLIGWTPGNLVGLYARPGVGKSWWLMWQGAIAWMEGKRVLAISGEMPANQLSLRIDALIGEMIGFPIDFYKLQRGDPSISENYKQIISELSESNRYWVYDSINGEPLSLGDITSLVRLHRPDVLLVDNISLLKAPPGQSWEQMKTLSYGIKNLSTIHNIPALVTHQAVNSARGMRKEIRPGAGDNFVMPSLNDSAYGDAFVQACSDVITFCGDPNSRFVLWYSIRKTRDRGWDQPMPMRMAFAWNPGVGKIIDLSERGYNPEVVGSEARRVLGINDLNG